MRHNDFINLLATRGAELRHSARRVARRALRTDPRARSEPPPSPVGAKLEITYACNLRCGFCYTDSPRRTLQRTPELSDAQWMDVVDQVIASGAIEAVVTGGEPLLRKQVTIDVCRRLAEAGLAVTLNSNGWFIDDEVAAGLAEAPGLHVHVSVDGPNPELHDAQRGVPGSWRRAIGGLDALIRHGVAVHAVHVITAENVDRIEDTLESLRVLGVTVVRATRVIETGAAAREGGWRVASTKIERALERFGERTGDAMNVGLQSGEGAATMIHSERAPAAILVRPNGMVRTDSLIPFSFGQMPEQSLDECWQRVREHWRDPEIRSWKASISAPTDLPKANLVAYLDDEVEVGVPAPASKDAGDDPRAATIPRRVPIDAVSATPRRVEDPTAHVERLALNRRYRAGEVRGTDATDSRLVRRLSDGRVWRLNHSASIVFDALNDGCPADAVAGLAEAFSGVSGEQLRADAITVTNSLRMSGLVLPVEARHFTATNAASTPDLPQVEAG